MLYQLNLTSLFCIDLSNVRPHKASLQVTDTELKLRDTQIQLELAAANLESAEVFRSCINAAVALGRSVTFVMQAESADSEETSR